MTQVESLDEIGPMAEEVKTLWIETEYEDGHDIPLPSYPEEYSGKFNLRLPRSLHRRLAEAAEGDGVSLNQHVLNVLASGQARLGLEQTLAEVAERQKTMEREIARLGSQVEEIRAQMTSYRVEGIRDPSRRSHRLYVLDSAVAA